MGCICTKHRFGHKDFEALASQTCFNAGEVEALYVLFKKLSSCLVDDGLISKEELQLGLLQSRKKRSLFTDRMFHLFDLKHDGVIEFQEFVHSLSVFHPSAPREEKALFAFQLYDIWQTGFIGRREVEELILALLKESDLILPWDAVDAIIDKTFQEADGKRDGKIDLEEWREFAAKNPSILKNMTIPYLKYISLSLSLSLSLYTMAKPRRRPPPPHSSAGRTNLASCVVATIFLVFVVIVVLIVFFTVFRPRDPKISVNGVQLPSFSIANDTVNFTFSQYVSVENPNKAVFSHFDSSIQLLYAGNQVGFMFVPAGKIAAGRMQYMAATFAVESFPLSPAPNPPSAVVAGEAVAAAATAWRRRRRCRRVGPTLEIESRMKMAGRVRVLHLFTHHVEARSDCRVAIAVSDGSVLGFHC
ncbi:uncharacterized protein LOC115740764 isoform X3 [Rhodamnia argentea]|uniref:Calcineurin B-like protein n=1 Tax=Rhodamnia argentea TaxID=178133 RepID=A0ABM3HX94_9MYRT|nr:uncharacterized protein LOC115740764 isoform X3 [Rhodamnia argentea]